MPAHAVSRHPHEILQSTLPFPRTLPDRLDLRESRADYFLKKMKLVSSFVMLHFYKSFLRERAHRKIPKNFYSSAISWISPSNRRQVAVEVPQSSGQITVTAKHKYGNTGWAWQRPALVLDVGGLHRQGGIDARGANFHTL